jgi:hypothetical protein
MTNFHNVLIKLFFISKFWKFGKFYTSAVCSTIPMAKDNSMVPGKVVNQVITIE